MYLLLHTKTSERMHPTHRNTAVVNGTISLQLDAIYNSSFLYYKRGAKLLSYIISYNLYDCLPKTFATDIWPLRALLDGQVVTQRS